jgi:hypothetical protein
MSSQDLQRHGGHINATVRGDLLKKLNEISLYRNLISDLIERLFGSISNFNSHRSWVELYGLLLLFHIYRWNRAMLLNKFHMLSHHFEEDWDRQGFKRRSEDLSKNKNRIQEFKSTVRLVNFFCDRCKRVGAVTGACDNTKCSNLNTLATQHTESMKTWVAGFNAWKATRGAGESKTHDSYISVTNKQKPNSAHKEADIWTSLISDQSVIRPLGNPAGFGF